MNIYLIRHAECTHNTTPEYIGGRSFDSELTKDGHGQASRLSEKLIDIGFDKVFSSPQERAYSTALHLRLSGWSNGQIVKDDRLIEYSAGDWEGKKRDEIYTPETKLKLAEQNFYFKYPNGESLAEVQSRAVDFLEKEILDKDYKNIAIITHGMVIRTLIHHILGMDKHFVYNMRIDNASITHFIYEDGKWTLGYINRI